jgi:ferredoxin
MKIMPNKNIMRGVKMTVKIDKEKCTGCGACVEICPVDAIKVDDIAIVDEKECIDCGTCVEECPVDAIEL